MFFWFSTAIFIKILGMVLTVWTVIFVSSCCHKRGVRKPEFSDFQYDVICATYLVFFRILGPLKTIFSFLNFMHDFFTIFCYKLLKFCVIEFFCLPKISCYEINQSYLETIYILAKLFRKKLLDISENYHILYESN